MTNREYVMMLAQMFCVKSDDPIAYSKVNPDAHSPVDESNKVEFGHLKFYTVGRNSSHKFSLAVDDNDNVYYRSFAVNYNYDTEIETVYERIHKMESSIQGQIPYMGHW